MITKLDTSDIITREQLAGKLNEMIDVINELDTKYHNHYHEYLGTPEEDNKTSYPEVKLHET